MLAREACEKTCKIYKTKFGPAIFFSLLPQQPWICLRTSSSQMDLSLHHFLLVLIPCSIVPIFRFFKATLCACCARTDQDRLFPLLLLLESELEQVSTTRRLEWENYYRRKSRLPSSVLSRIFFSLNWHLNDMRAYERDYMAKTRPDFSVFQKSQDDLPTISFNVLPKNDHMQLSLKFKFWKSPGTLGSAARVAVRIMMNYLRSSLDRPEISVGLK